MSTPNSGNNSFSTFLIPASIIFAGILVAGAVFYSLGRTPSPLPVSENTPTTKSNSSKAAIKLSGAPELTPEDVILGNPQAPVTIVEYADYQCPYCENFHSDAGMQIRAEYIKTGKVKMVFRNFPFLDQFPGSQNESHLAAEAVECAKDQGKFWAFHDAIFDFKAKDSAENSGNLNRDLFQKIAGTLGLNSQDFLSCFDSQKYAGKIESDLVSGQAYGVESTPTIFVNDVKIEGLMPYDDLVVTDPQIKPYKQAIDAALRKVERSSP